MNDIRLHYRLMEMSSSALHHIINNLKLDVQFVQDKPMKEMVLGMIEQAKKQGLMSHLEVQIIRNLNEKMAYSFYNSRNREAKALTKRESVAMTNKVSMDFIKELIENADDEGKCWVDEFAYVTVDSLEATRHRYE